MRLLKFCKSVPGIGYGVAVESYLFESEERDDEGEQRNESGNETWQKVRMVSKE